MLDPGAGRVPHRSRLRPQRNVTRADSVAVHVSNPRATRAPVFAATKPDLAVVQGDTTSTSVREPSPRSTAESRSRTSKVRAMRTGDLQQPFPEELQPRPHQPPPPRSTSPRPRRPRRNLQREGVLARHRRHRQHRHRRSALRVRRRLAPVTAVPGKRLILVTAHRRESFGPGFEQICEALLELAARPPTLPHRLPRPPEPERTVRGDAAPWARIPNITLDGADGVRPLRRPHASVPHHPDRLRRDQEEAPSLGKPVLVLREKTERPEAVTAGTVKLVGTDTARIVEETSRLLDDPAEYQRMSHRHNPYGDGHASERIEAALLEKFAGARAPTPTPTFLLAERGEKKRGGGGGGGGGGRSAARGKEESHTRGTRRSPGR